LNLEISSKLTIFFKFIFPGFWICVFGYCFIRAFILGHSIKWFFLFIWLIGIFFSYRFLIPLKQVRIDGNDLIVTNFSKRISISTKSIEKVDEMVFSIHPVFVIFKNETEFGKRIIFMPKKIISFGGSHPVVKLLQSLINSGGEEAIEVDETKSR
jgi:hypothetical protein